MQMTEHIYYTTKLGTLYLGDCLELLKQLPDNSVDSIVTDPPAGISFMNEKWDTYSNADLTSFQKFIFQVFSEAIGVLKPGGHALVWGLPRTSHHTAMGLERAGFEIRDIVHHIFASGFPKNLNIGKKIDQMKNKEAEQWKGWGTALKPAIEHWILCRKPLSEKTIALNILKHRTGGLNIDKCRTKIEIDREPDTGDSYYLKRNLKYPDKGSAKILGQKSDRVGITMNKGRFPSNLVLQCICGEVKPGKSGKPIKIKRKRGSSMLHCSNIQVANAPDQYNDTAPKHSAPNCPCYILDLQSGTSKTLPRLVANGKKLDKNGKWGFKRLPHYISDEGGASRFFYVAKASGSSDIEKLKIKGEKHLGCENLYWLDGKLIDKDLWLKLRQENIANKDKKHNIQWGNIHFTVKPLKLIEYFVKLITPPGGIVLDMFQGSGTTAIACEKLGFNWIGIEKYKEFCEIAKRRISIEAKQQKLMFNKEG